MGNVNNALSAQQGISLSNWDAMRQQAEVLVKSGFLPRDINTPEKAIAVMMTGAELNIPPMQALRQIAIIQGKPTVSPELMAALVERDYGSNALIVEESTQERCVVSCLKPGWDKRRSISFTILDAQRAKLETDTWKKYPVAMLRSRAISIACKTYFQASIGGMYTGEELGGTPEELGADVDVVDGDVVIVEPRRSSTFTAVTVTGSLDDPKETQYTISADEPGLSIVDVLTGELDSDDPHLLTAYDMLADVKTRHDITDLALYMDEHGLRSDDAFMAAYTAKWEQVTGKRAPVSNAQPALID